MDEQARQLWTDWVTIWQSELAALAADRETQEMLQRAIDGWAARAIGSSRPEPADEPAGCAGPVPAPRAAAAAAAPLAIEPALARWLASFALPSGR